MLTCGIESWSGAQGTHCNLSCLGHARWSRQGMQPKLPQGKVAWLSKRCPAHPSMQQLDQTIPGLGALRLCSSQRSVKPMCLRLLARPQDFCPCAGAMRGEGVGSSLLMYWGGAGTIP